MKLTEWIRPTPFTYDILLDRSNGKWIFTILEDNKKFSINFTDDYNAHRSFGFANLENAEASYPLKSITSSRVAQLSGSHQIFIRSSLGSTQSIENKENKISSNLLSIVIDVPHFDMIIYKRLDDSNDIFIQQKSVDEFTLVLSDSEGNELQLNGLDFEIVLSFKTMKSFSS